MKKRVDVWSLNYFSTYSRKTTEIYVDPIKITSTPAPFKGYAAIVSELNLQLFSLTITRKLVEQIYIADHGNRS